MKTIGLGIKSSREWRKTMRIEKERMEKKLDKLFLVVSIISIITGVEFAIGIVCAFAGIFTEKMFEINKISVGVIIGIYMFVRFLLANFDRKEEWKDVATEKYKYTNIKDFNLTERTVTCINNGAEETFKINEIKDPEDNDNFATIYVKRKICKKERHFLWQTVEDTKETTILYAAKDVIKRKNKLEKRQAEQAAENEYQIIC